MTTVFTLRDFRSVVMALANSGASVWALCGFVLALFAGIARVIRAFDAAMSAVERIVTLRDPRATGHRHTVDHHPPMLSASATEGQTRSTPSAL